MSTTINEFPSALSAAVHFSRLTAQRDMFHNDNDFAYCLAVHFVANQNYSQDTQNVLLYKAPHKMIALKQLQDDAALTADSQDASESSS